MTSLPRIDSRHNPRFKEWKRLLARPQVADCPWVAVEGWKAAVELAVSRPIQLLLCSDSDRPEFETLRRRSAQAFLLPERLLRGLSSVESFQGLLAFFEKPSWDWPDLPSRLLFAWKLQDPGNLGGLLRTARATGFGVVCGPDTVSCYNPKAVRASSAALFFTPILENATPLDVRRRGYRLVAATSREGVPFWEADWTPPLAVLVGNEGRGLEVEILAGSDQLVHIPMRGGAESLNAAVAGSLLLYEAIREKGEGRSSKGEGRRAKGEVGRGKGEVPR